MVSRGLALLLPLVAAWTVAGCELTQITLAVPDDIIIAEVLLRAGSARQTAYLHRTGGADRSASVLGALIRIEEEGSTRALEFAVGADTLCVVPSAQQSSSSIGTCYTATGPADLIRPGGRYTLRIDVAGRLMTGMTQVPGTFTMVRPGQASCLLAPDTVLELEWTRAEGAWVYVGEVRFSGLRAALLARGVTVTGMRPIELTGLSVGGADTTMVFPAEFGVFQRFEAELHPILVAIADGLPPGVVADITVAAADRNYVNWVRGGTFNPSGLVRTPSIQGGGGTGVFGSLVPVNLTVRTGGSGALPNCHQ